jgi:hypothetical protein
VHTAPSLIWVHELAEPGDMMVDRVTPMSRAAARSNKVVQAAAVATGTLQEQAAASHQLEYGQGVRTTFYAADFFGVGGATPRSPRAFRV